MFNKFTEWKLAFKESENNLPSLFSQHLKKEAIKDNCTHLQSLVRDIRVLDETLCKIQVQYEQRILEQQADTLGSPIITAKSVNIYFSGEVQKNIERLVELQKRHRTDEKADPDKENHRPNYRQG